MHGACVVPYYLPLACAEVVAHACLDQLAAIFDCQIICSLASSVMSLPIGLANLGASCCINASLQSLLAVPALRAAIATGTEPLETALGSVLRKLESRRGPVMPTEITSLFYRGHQEDAAEFLVVLLSECPALHPCLRGLEIPLLRCQLLLRAIYAP